MSEAQNSSFFTKGDSIIKGLEHKIQVYKNRLTVMHKGIKVTHSVMLFNCVYINANLCRNCHGLWLIFMWLPVCNLSSRKTV